MATTAAGLSAVMIAATTFANADADAFGHGYYYGSMNLESVYNSETELYELRDATRGGTAVYDAGEWYGNCAAQPANCALRNTTRPPLMTDVDNEWGDLTLEHPNVKQTQAVDAYYAAAKAWDYFAAVHGRRGIAGDGRGVALYTNINGQNMSQGALGFGAGNGTDLAGSDCDWRGEPDLAGPPDGLADCLYVRYAHAINTPKPGATIDLVGGAYALGVVRNTARLTGHPEGQGLALATGHIFGTMIEFHANNSKDRPDYRFGELQTPSSYVYLGDPGKRVGSTGPVNRNNVSCWTAQLASHTDPELRAGPADFFFFLLAAGGAQGSFPFGRFQTCDGRLVKGIGNAKAEKIWYRALTEYMNEATDYKAARIATLRAAADLYGAHGLEYNTVNSAWEAVSVRGAHPLPGSSKPLLTSPGDQWTSLGRPVNVQIEASDPRGLPLNYYIASDYEDPETGSLDIPGLSINPTTGLITGTPGRKGTYRVSLTVTNSIAEATNTWFTWTVA